MSKLKFLIIFPILLAAGICQADSSQNAEHAQAVDMYRQAMSHLLGRNDLEKSPEKAAKLFQSLAEKNWIPAQHMLGNLYMKGKGVQQSDVLAYQWLSLAAKNNNRLASTLNGRRAQLRSRLSKYQLRQADDWVTGWQPKAGLAMN